MFKLLESPTCAQELHLTRYMPCLQKFEEFVLVVINSQKTFPASENSRWCQYFVLLTITALFSQ